MNIRVLGVALTLACVGSLTAQNISDATPSAPTVTERGPHHRVWQSVTQTTDANGESIYQTNSYTEIQTGLHYWDEGQWKESVPEFEFYEGKGFVARRGQIKAILSSRLEPGCVDMETPSGRFRSHILGLSYFDPISGESVVIAQSKGVEGQQVAPNIIIYPDCFDNIHADLRLTITRYGFEQDIILREPITATPESYGLDAKTTQLEGMTEFIELPSGTRQEQVTDVQTNSLVRTLMAAPDQTDDILNFGTTTFGSGRAFMLNDSEGQDVRVNKALRNVDGRTVLFESISYGTAKQMMNKLGSSLKKDSQRQYAVGELKGQVRHSRVLPKSTFPKSEIKQMASLNKPGVVLDYYTLETSKTNYAFLANWTYYVSGPVYLYGTTTFEGGAVIKMAPTNSAKIQINSAFNWISSTYRPVVVTARDDNSVGETINSSTGTPVMYPGPAMSFTANSQIRNLRVAYAQSGVQAASGTTLEVVHGQFVNCYNAIQATSANVTLRNILFNNVTNVFSGSSTVGRCEHLTVNGAGAFNYNNACSSLYVTNSLLVGVTTLGSYSGVGTSALTSPAGVFQSTWGGSNYLAAGSPYRNAGNMNINASLASDLRHLTTYPPQVMTNSVFGTPTLWPQAQRDTDALDVGYHYPPLDYILRNQILSSTCLLTNGVAIAASGSYGLDLQYGGIIISEGKPNELNRFVRYTQVQESAYADAGGHHPPLMKVTTRYGTLPEVHFRFTELALCSSLNQKILDIGSYYPLASVDFSHCSLSGGNFYITSWNETRTMTIAFTNSLVERTTLYCEQPYGGGPDSSPMPLYMYNNLFRNCTLTLKDSVANAPWRVYDNVFEGVYTTSAGSSLSNGYNGYINSNELPNATSNVVLSAFSYTSGALGRYYQTSTNFINRGSRYANDAGLAHQTTQVTNEKETDSRVDIGLHYVATDTNGIPLDQDGDGLPDYLEDRNGNLTTTDDATSWQSYNTQNSLGGSTVMMIFTPVK